MICPRCAGLWPAMLAPFQGPPGPPGPVGSASGFGAIDYTDLDAVVLDTDGDIIAGTAITLAANAWTRVTRRTAPSPSNTNLPRGPWSGFGFWDGALLHARAIGDGYLFKFAFRVRPYQRDGAIRFAVRPGGNEAFDFGPDATTLTVDASEVEIGSRSFFEQVRSRFAMSGAEIYVFSTTGGELLEFSPEVAPLFHKP